MSSVWLENEEHPIRLGRGVAFGASSPLSGERYVWAVSVGDTRLVEAVVRGVHGVGMGWTWVPTPVLMGVMVPVVASMWTSL